MTNIMQSAAFTSEQIDRRAYSVATNAIREMRVAYGRDAGPWTDDDCRRLNAIFEILHLARAEEIDMQTESFPLVAPQQAPENPLLEEFEKSIERLNNIGSASPAHEPPKAVNAKNK